MRWHVHMLIYYVHFTGMHIYFLVKTLDYYKINFNIRIEDTRPVLTSFHGLSIQFNAILQCSPKEWEVNILAYIILRVVVTQVHWEIMTDHNKMTRFYLITASPLYAWIYQHWRQIYIWDLLTALHNSGF